MTVRLTIFLALLLSSWLANADWVAESHSNAPAASTVSITDAITPQVRDRMQAIQNQQLPEPINCWGVALWTMGFTDGLRPALKSELLDHLNSSACRKLEPTEAVQRGDIGSWYSADLGIVHSYVILGTDRLFEKGSPKAEDLPQTITTIEKFSQQIDLRSGCKQMQNGTCALGIVNYRCKAALIESGREESYSKLTAQRHRVRFLYKALSDALDGGSAAAVNDAYMRYMDQIDNLMRESMDKSTRLLASEAFSGLLLVQGKTKQLSLPSMQRFLKIADRFDQLENQTPRTLSEFPAGSLR